MYGIIVALWDINEECDPEKCIMKTGHREYNTIRCDNIAQIVILSNLFYHAEDFSTIVTIHTSGFERVR